MVTPSWLGGETCGFDGFFWGGEYHDYTSIDGKSRMERLKKTLDHF